MSKTRKPVAYKLKTILQKEINSLCPFCSDDNVDHFEIHHINENPSENNIENLLMLCPLCHSKITKGDLTYNDVLAAKRYLAIRNQNSNKIQSINKLIIGGDVSNSTIANSLSANTIIYKGKTKPKMEYADGSIGKIAESKNYISYLIKRYNEFKLNEVGKEKMNYKAIYSSIIKEFRASAYQIPLSQIEILSNYLKKRIDNTRLGRINQGKGIKNYSSFEDVY
ncbi:hypothetical protein A5893_02270 [Pedobacter psychrophilus]|uniref:HNH nuclease domain-containing protein n=1 Tax=Pedobacter psychrophilus TaxID=1826909 RepID=A0A179DLM4_9SPHI|nr:HNH endonuclease signature motif containing protein [Pedobacter psychrophilus]OAQ41965.1 hypothetical protein A5893_02270 [Pedobacter psychrophilus]